MATKKGKVRAVTMADAKARRKNVPLWDRPLLHTNKVRRILIQLKVDPQDFEREYVNDKSRTTKAVPTPVEIEVSKAYCAQQVDFNEAKSLLSIKSDSAFLNTVERVRKFQAAQAKPVVQTGDTAELSTSL